MIYSFIILALFGQVQEDIAIPLKGDETSLIRVKADPDKYLGKEIIICGGVAISDYYNFGYENSHNTHYSLKFVELGKDTNQKGEDVSLYFQKRLGAAIIQTITKEAEQSKGNFYKIARVKVLLDSHRFADGKQWDLLEVRDVQFLRDNKKDWMPWIIENQASNERKKLEELEKLKLEEKRQKEALALEKQKVIEEAKWHKWTSADGKFTSEAKFLRQTGGIVYLQKRDGKSIEIPKEKLSKENLDWINNRGWTKTK